MSRRRRSPPPAVFASGPTASPGGEPASAAPPVPLEATIGVRGMALLWLFLACIYPLHDTDFWWHLRTGELIYETGAVPQVDWFTFTDHEQPWIDLHWGFQLLITPVFWLAGVDGVILLKAALYTVAVAVAWRAGRGPSELSDPARPILTGADAPAWLEGAVWLLPMICISGRAIERPEMLTLVFLALSVWVYRRAETHPASLWWLPLIQLVWVNCHALFILGLVTGACYVAGILLRARAAGRWGLAPLPRQFSARTLGLVAVLSAAVSFVNPYFEEGALFPLVLYRKFNVEQSFYSTRIGEFLQPWVFVRDHGLTNLYLLAELGVLVQTTATFLVLGRLGRWSPFRGLLFLAVTHLAWEATRNTSLFALVCGTLSTANLRDAWHLSAWSEAPAPARWRARGAIAVFAGLMALVVSGDWNRLGDGNKPFAIGEAPGWFMHDGARLAGRPGFPDHAFVAHIGQAAVYTYHNGPNRRVFMDGRLEVVSRSTFELYETLLALMAARDRRWEAVLRDSAGQLPAVLLDSRHSRAAIVGLYLTPGWRLVHADGAGAVFIEAALADRLQLPPADIAPLRVPPGTRAASPRPPTPGP